MINSTIFVTVIILYDKKFWLKEKSVVLQSHTELFEDEDNGKSDSKMQKDDSRYCDENKAS